MRCHALTKGWTRCRGNAEVGKLFCYSHRGWLLGAIITAMVTIVGLCAGLSQIFDAQLPNPLATKTPLLTFTETQMPTFIPTFLTETPIPDLAYTSLPTEILTPVSPETFRGLASDCIPDLYWNTLDSKIIPNAKGCLQLDSWGLHAAEREIIILLNPQDVRESIARTIFTPISGNTEISFDLTLEDIKDGSDPNAPPLFSVGICNPDKIKTAHNFISYNYLGDGPVGWGILNNDESRFQQYSTYTLNTPQSFAIKVESFDLFIEDSKTESYIWANPKVSPSDLQAFCIRYQVPTLGTLKVSISDFSIVEK